MSISKERKEELKETSLHMMANWILSNLENGCLSYYGDDHHLSDEELLYMDKVMRAEMEKLHTRAQKKDETR